MLTPPAPAPGVVFWFRNDLRLTDNPALHTAQEACAALDNRPPGGA